MKCIVLSGATVPFQSLVDAIDSSFVQELARYGFTDIEVQHGHAQPSHVAGVQYFSFDSDIGTKIQESQLVISHAGTGSILDSVERGEGHASRKVVVVVNDRLMNNHQLEVATKLEQLSCIYMCDSPRSLSEALSVIMHRKFAKLENPTSLQLVVNQELARKWA